MSIETILAQLAGVRRSGAGWSARCPAHDDRHASLSVAEGEDGRVLLRCHAGCSTEAIVTALGLSMADLFPAATAGPKSGPTRRGPRPVISGRFFGVADEAIAALERQHGLPSARWAYHDAAGGILGLILRWDGAAGKTIRPIARCPGGWRIGAMPEPRPLYGLPELLRADPSSPVVVVEGEKCADAARSLGFVTTTSSGGAQAAARSDWSPLRGRSVAILPDADDAGRHYARDVARLAAAAGAAAVRIVELPGLPPGGDIADWVAAGGTRADLDRLIAAAGPWSAGAASAGPAAGALATRRMDAIAPAPVKWLWAARLPAGMLTILDGDPGLGKSTITADIAARVTTGRAFPGAHAASAPAAVAFLCSEDSAEHVIRPRLEAAGADLTRCHVIETIDAGTGTRPIILPDDMPAIEQFLLAQGVRLLVVDPLFGFVASQVDTHKDASIRTVLHRLKLLAERTGAAVLALRHLNKSAGGSALYRGGGSIAIAAQARSVLTVGRHPERPDECVLATTKCNLAARPKAITYRIEPALAGTVETSRVAWGDECDLEADDLVVRSGSDQRRGEAVAAAEEFLRVELASGPRPAADLITRAEAAGIKRGVIFKARQVLGVRAFKRGFGGDWIWSLDHRPEDSQPKDSRTPDNRESLEKQGDLPKIHDPTECESSDRESSAPPPSPGYIRIII